MKNGAKGFLPISTCALLMNSERIQMDLVPCKRKQFRIRSRVNTMIKMDQIQNYPDSFRSDLYPFPCKRGLSNFCQKIEFHGTI